MTAVKRARIAGVSVWPGRLYVVFALWFPRRPYSWSGTNFATHLTFYITPPSHLPYLELHPTLPSQNSFYWFRPFLSSPHNSSPPIYQLSFKKKSSNHSENIYVAFNFRIAFYKFSKKRNNKSKCLLLCTFPQIHYLARALTPSALLRKTFPRYLSFLRRPRVNSDRYCCDLALLPPQLSQ